MAAVLVLRAAGDARGVSEHGPVFAKHANSGRPGAVPTARAAKE